MLYIYAQGLGFLHIMVSLACHKPKYRGDHIHWQCLFVVAVLGKFVLILCCTDHYLISMALNSTIDCVVLLDDFVARQKSFYNKILMSQL